VTIHIALTFVHYEGWVLGLTTEHKVNTSAGTDATNLTQHGRGKIIGLR